MAIGLLLAALIVVVSIARSNDSATAAAGNVTIATKTFKLKKPNKAVRYEVRCHNKAYPLGGGVITTPPVSGNGQGVYPTSSERLGEQRGWHIGAVLLGPRKLHRVKLQVACGKNLGQVKAVHHAVKVRHGHTKRAVSKCPHGRHILAGGFLSSLLIKKKGIYATASRQLSAKAWAVTAHAFGKAKHAVITSVAYCIKGKAHLTHVQQSATFNKGLNTVSTPPCPGTLKLVLGGYNTPSSGSVRVFDPHFTDIGTWSVSGHSSKDAQHVTAFGYCL